MPRVGSPEFLERLGSYREEQAKFLGGKESISVHAMDVVFPDKEREEKGEAPSLDKFRELVEYQLAKDTITESFNEEIILGYWAKLKEVSPEVAVDEELKKDLEELLSRLIIYRLRMEKTVSKESAKMNEWFLDIGNKKIEIFKITFGLDINTVKNKVMQIIEEEPKYLDRAAVEERLESI